MKFAPGIYQHKVHLDYYYFGPDERLWGAWSDLRDTRRARDEKTNVLNGSPEGELLEDFAVIELDKAASPTHNGFYRVWIKSPVSSVSDKAWYAHWNGKVWHGGWADLETCRRHKDDAILSHLVTKFEPIEFDLGESKPAYIKGAIYKLTNEKYAPTEVGLYSVIYTPNGSRYFSWWNGERFAYRANTREEALERKNDSLLEVKYHTDWKLEPKVELKAEPVPTKSSLLPTLRGVYEVKHPSETTKIYAYWHSNGWGPYTPTTKGAFERRDLKGGTGGFHYNPPGFFTSWSSCGWEEPLGTSGPIVATKKQIYKRGIYKVRPGFRGNGGEGDWFVFSYGDGTCSGWNSEPKFTTEAQASPPGPYKLGWDFLSPVWYGEEKGEKVTEAPRRTPSTPGYYMVQAMQGEGIYYSYWNGHQWCLIFRMLEDAMRQGDTAKTSWTVTQWQEIEKKTDKVKSKASEMNISTPSPKARAVPSQPLTDRRRLLLT